MSMKHKEKRAKVLAVCLRCDYRWPSRIARPRSCPLCHSYKWEEPKETFVGRLGRELNIMFKQSCALREHLCILAHHIHLAFLKTVDVY